MTRQDDLKLLAQAVELIEDQQDLITFLLVNSSEEDVGTGAIGAAKRIAERAKKVKEQVEAMQWLAERGKGE